jgi:hypothetical protein
MSLGLKVFDQQSLRPLHRDTPTLQQRGQEATDSGKLASSVGEPGDVVAHPQLGQPRASVVDDARPGAQLGDPQLQVPGRGHNTLGRRPLRCAERASARFVRFGADHRGQFGLGQRLVDHRGRLADPVGDVGLLDRVQELEQGRLPSDASWRIMTCLMLVYSSKTYLDMSRL